MVIFYNVRIKVTGFSNWPTILTVVFSSMSSPASILNFDFLAFYVLYKFIYMYVYTQYFT